MMAEIRVLLADDHPACRDGLRQAIEKEKNLKVVAETGDAEATLRLIEQLQPDVAVLDIYMPRRNDFGEPESVAFDVARAVQQRRLPVQIVFLTGDRTKESFEAAQRAGVKGYMLKSSATTEIVVCVRAVAEGRHFISPLLSSYLVNHHRREDAFIAQHPRLNELTRREKEILKLVSEGRSSHEIADKLHISAPAVDNYRSSIRHRLDLEGPTALIKFAYDHKEEIARLCIASE